MFLTFTNIFQIYNISEIVTQSNGNFDKSFNVYAAVFSGKQVILFLLYILRCEKK